jgi:ectoine hydroxylase-related dioxygenase (phytanoyl-CoA dioxygenase family)
LRGECREVIQAAGIGKRSFYRLVEDENNPFMQFVRHPNLLTPLTLLLGPDVEFNVNRHNHLRFNFRDDQKVELHRDVLNPTRTIITAIVYLEDSTVQNGCTMILPGSHNYLPDMPHTPKGGGGTWAHDYEDEFGALDAQALPVPVSAGSVLLFNSLVFHSITPNQTDGSRIALAFAYTSHDELATVKEPEKILIVGKPYSMGNNKVAASAM